MSNTNQQSPAAGQAAHTVTPWGQGKYCHGNEHTNRKVWAGSKLVAVTYTKEDAAFIVTACNAYDANQKKIAALTEALNNLLPRLESHPAMQNEWTELASAIGQTRKALAL